MYAEKETIGQCFTKSYLLKLLNGVDKFDYSTVYKSVLIRSMDDEEDGSVMTIFLTHLSMAYIHGFYHFYENIKQHPIMSCFETHDDFYHCVPLTLIEGREQFAMLAWSREEEAWVIVQVIVAKGNVVKVFKSGYFESEEDAMLVAYNITYNWWMELLNTLNNSERNNFNFELGNNDIHFLFKYCYRYPIDFSKRLESLKYVRIDALPRPTTENEKAIEVLTYFNRYVNLNPIPSRFIKRFEVWYKGAKEQE